MSTNGKTKSVTGPMLLMVVLLVDVGLVIWGWHLYQRRQERYDGTAFDLSDAPETTQPYGGRFRQPAQARPEPLAAPSRRPVQTDVPVRTRESRPERRTAARGRRTSGGQSLDVRRAVRCYYDLKKSPQFRNSAVIRKWTQEFLSHKDLREINARYQEDRNAVRFLMDTVRSPNFRPMVERYLQTEDMRSFLKEMISSPEVMASSRDFMRDSRIRSTVQKLGITPAGMQEGAADPRMQRLLQEEGRRLLSPAGG